MNEQKPENANEDAVAQSALNVRLDGLSTRAQNVLTRAGLNNVDEVRTEWRRREPSGFLREPNCGKMANAEIREWAGIDTANFPARDVIIAIDLLTEKGYTIFPPNVELSGAASSRPTRTAG